MSDNWFYQAGGRARASTSDNLADLFRSGMIDAHTPVWQEGFANWQPLGEAMPELAQGTATPPPFMPAPLGEVSLGGAAAIAPGFSPLPVDDAAPALPAMPKLAVQDDGWQDTQPHPWRRYLARMIDFTVLSAVTGLVLGAGLVAVAPELHEKLFFEVIGDNRLADGMLSALLVTPVLALLIGLFGTSPGKWFMGVRLTRRDGRPIGVGAAMRRELDVYVRGIALGIPIIALFTLWAGFKKLTEEGVTSWDRDEPWVVTHRPSGALQVILGVVGVIVWAFVYGLIMSMD